MTPLSPPTQRYARRALAALTLYAGATALVAVWAASGARAPPILRLAAALVPGAPVLAAVVATARYFAEETDALQRVIQVEALVWAIGVTFGIATVWGLLQPLVGAPGVPSYCAFAVFASVVGSVQVSRRLFPRRAGAPETP